jgi:hypothetical protein
VPTLGDFVATLDKRFVATIWLPVQVFLVALGAIVLTTSGWTRAVDAWQGLTGVGQVLAAVGAVGLGTLLAYLVSTQIPLLIRLYEGRWPDRRPLRALAERGRRRQRKVLADLITRGPQHRALLEYPSAPEDVLPTRFGNILRAGELHSLQRYKLDAVVIWPRLYSCLPEPVVRQVAAAKGDVALVAGPSWAALLALVGGAAVGWLSYRGALVTGLTYATVVRTVFDVHRYAVLEQLRWHLPSSWKQERRQWQAIGQLWARGGVGSEDAAAALGYQASSPPGGQRQASPAVGEIDKPQSDPA